MVLSCRFHSRLSKSTASEYAENNILINAVGSGRIQTDGVTEKIVIFIEELRDGIKVVIPIRRYGEPVKFANHFMFRSKSVFDRAFNRRRSNKNDSD